VTPFWFWPLSQLLNPVLSVYTLCKSPRISITPSLFCPPGRTSSYSAPSNQQSAIWGHFCHLSPCITNPFHTVWTFSTTLWLSPSCSGWSHCSLSPILTWELEVAREKRKKLCSVGWKLHSGLEFQYFFLMSCHEDQMSKCIQIKPYLKSDPETNLPRFQREVEAFQTEGTIKQCPDNSSKLSREAWVPPLD
jgi:hypothetical protein